MFEDISVLGFQRCLISHFNHRSQGGDLAKEDDSAYIRIYLEQHFGISGDTCIYIFLYFK